MNEREIIRSEIADIYYSLLEEYEIEKNDYESDCKPGPTLIYKGKLSGIGEFYSRIIKFFDENPVKNNSAKNVVLNSNPEGKLNESM